MPWRSVYTWHPRDIRWRDRKVRTDSGSDLTASWYKTVLSRQNHQGRWTYMSFLEDGGLPGEEFISGLQDFLDDETRRPPTDHVVVKAPQTVEYTIEGTYYISRDRQEMAAVIQKQVEAARDEFIRWQKSAIARDINPSRLIYGLVAAGAKWVDLKSPGFQKMEGASVAVASGVNLAYGGVQDE